MQGLASTSKIKGLMRFLLSLKDKTEKSISPHGYRKLEYELAHQKLMHKTGLMCLFFYRDYTKSTISCHK